MIALGLSGADLALFNQSLSTHHNVKVTVQILTLNHAYVDDVSDQLLDGQVNIDAGAEVTRSLTLQLNDPERTLKLDSTAPTDGALFYDRMIRVIYSVKSELLPRWVDVPIFCGPVTAMSRTVDVVNVECQGKEALVLPPSVAYTTRTFIKGWTRASLVRSIMANYGGETRFSIPDFGEKTPSATVMNGELPIWPLVKAVNGNFGVRQLFYDGRGVLVMRSTPRAAGFTFKTGVGGNVTTLPSVSYDLSNVRNIVRVKGAIPKGKKTPVTQTVGLPRTNPLNHYALGRNGVPRAMMEIVTDDNQKTVAQAKNLATRLVNDRALQAVDVTFDALVAPHLEPYDLYTLRTPDISMTARYTRGTIPLKSAVGNVGYMTKRSTNKTRIRRR